MTINLLSRGHKLLSYQPLSAPEVPAEDAHIPVTFVMVIAKLNGRSVWQYNPERQQWEIPGGGIEPNEHPDETAKRELMEEASQISKNLVCKGIFKIRLEPDKRLELGYLYAGDLEELAPLVVNNEAERLHLWDLQEALDGGISDVSYQMFDFLPLDKPYQAE